MTPEVLWVRQLSGTAETLRRGELKAKYLICQG